MKHLFATRVSNYRSVIVAISFLGGAAIAIIANSLVVCQSKGFG